MTEVQEEIVNVTAYAIFQAGFHPDDWGDELTSVVRQKWNEWPDERDRCAKLARAALLASGLPAAIEARDKALERVKALEAALENYFQAFDHGGTLLQTADKLCELRDVFRWGHP